MQKTLKAKKGGFTLIEILVVIGIIAILAAVVLIAINPARQFAQANDSQRVSNVNAILNAVGQFMADHKGDLPGDPIPATATEIYIALCDDLVPIYMPAMPTDPDSSSDGAGIACSDVVTGAVDYLIFQDATTDRITVSAAAEIPENDPIEVTR